MIHVVNGLLYFIHLRLVMKVSVETPATTPKANTVENDREGGEENPPEEDDQRHGLGSIVI
jgi:hypothetical protein